MYEELIMRIGSLTSCALRNTHVTLKEYIFENYVPFLESRSQKEVNFRRMFGVLKIIASYPMADKSFNSIDENDLTVFFNSLKKERGISKSTVNRYRARLNAIFNHGLKSKVIFYNPVKYVSRAKEYARNRILSREEMLVFLECCRQSANPELYPVVMVALYTGMRYSNVINMKKADIHGSSYYLSGEETKSGNGQKISLNSRVKTILDDFMRNNDNGGRVFKTRYVQRSFRTALKRAGIYDFRFHDLRRTFATYLLETGSNIKIIQTMLGHSSVIMTERYLAVDKRKELDAVERLCFNY